MSELDKLQTKCRGNKVLKNKSYLEAVVGRLWVPDLDLGHRHGRPHIIDHGAGVHPRVLLHWVPDLEAPVPCHIDVGH